MKKIDPKYTIPTLMVFMLPITLLGMPAFLLLFKLPEGADFFDTWLYTIKNNTPYSILFLIIVIPTVRTFVYTFLIDNKKEKSPN